MKVLVLISLVGGLMLSSCGGSSSKNNASGKEVNPADTIYSVSYTHLTLPTIA